MKADMEAMKEQMTTMMEAMMSMRKMMEDNTATIVAASTATEMDPIHPAGFNQVNHPISDVVGEGAKAAKMHVGLILFRFRINIPSHHISCLLIIHRPLLNMLLVRISAVLHPY